MKNMYKKSLILFGLYCIFWIILSIVLSLIIGSGGNFTNFIPISDMGIEVGLITIIILPFSSIVGLLIGGYIFSPAYLFLHKKIFGSKVEYGIFEKPEIGKFKYVSRGIFSALMAINFSLLLLRYIPNLAYISVGSVPDSEADFATTFIALLMITISLASSLFSATWFLSDAGILYSNRRKLNETIHPAEIRSVGRWYEQFLKGYAGVSVMLSYFEFITIFFIEIAGDIELFIIVLIIFIPFPIFVLIPTIPSLIISDKIKERRIRYVRKVANKLGIKPQVDVIFEIKD